MRSPRLALVALALTALTLVAPPAGAGGGNGTRGGAGGVGIDQNGGTGSGGGRGSGGYVGNTRPICGRNSALGPCSIEYNADRTCARYTNPRRNTVGVWRLTDPTTGAITNEICGDGADPAAAAEVRSKYLTPTDRPAALLPDGTDTPGLAGLPTFIAMPTEFAPGGKLDGDAVFLPRTRRLDAAVIDLHLVDPANPDDLTVDERRSGRYACRDTTENLVAPDASPFPVGSALRVVAQRGDGTGPVTSDTNLVAAQAGDVPDAIRSNFTKFGLTGDAKLLQFEMEQAGTFKVWLQSCWVGTVVQIRANGGAEVTSKVRILHTQLVSDNYVVSERRSVITGR